jgi:cell wall-associated NlpC family hydrolase
MHGRTTRFAIVVAVLVTLGTTLVPVVAGADTVSDEQATAQQLENSIESNARKLDALDEELNQAQIDFDTANIAVNHADAMVATTEARRKHLRARVAKRAASTYQHSFDLAGIAGLGARTALDFATREHYAAVAQQLDRKLATALARADEELMIRREQASKARAAAAARRDAVQTARTDLLEGDRYQRALLAQARYTALVTPTAGAQPSASSPTTAPAPTPTTAPPPPTTTPPPTSPPPPNSGRGAIAVAYAQNQLGKPYCYGGVGPNCFDCSGLTMMAWAQAGVTMPHSSSAQGAMFPVVPVDQMQPGDLTIEYADHSHVSIYIGNGMMITAPHTGDFVKIAPAFGDGWGFQYAVRPG